MTEPTPMVDPVHTIEAHVVDAATHTPQHVPLFRRLLKTPTGLFAGLLMAMPGIVLLLAARAVLGPSMWTAMAIFGVLMSPAFYRLVYAAVTAVRSELYVDAARVSGLSDLRIIGRHILTVVRAPV